MKGDIYGGKRYFVLSIAGDAEEFARTGTWDIENSEVIQKNIYKKQTSHNGSHAVLPLKRVGLHNGSGLATLRSPAVVQAQFVGPANGRVCRAGEIP
jgi:hypothetical protein